MTRVDAHQHFWKLARGDYRWLTPELGALYRDHQPADLVPSLETCGIGRTVLVQAADSLAETHYLLELARQHEFVAGVVGWVDMADPHAPRTIGALAREPKLVGVRPMIQDIEDDAWMLGRDLTPAFEALVEHSLCFDALVKPRHLGPLRTLLERHPQLDVVVDHGGKPVIRRRYSDWNGWEQWRTHMRELASFERTHVKLSGLVTEAETNWSVDELRPFTETLFDAFGTERVMWGSDWPVVEMAGGYARWWTATARLLGTLAAPQRDDVLGRNAERFYGLDRAGERAEARAGQRKDA